MNIENFEYSEIEIKSLEWWNSLDLKQQSDWIYNYYVQNKIGLNLQEIVKLYKKQNEMIDIVKKKRERFKINNTITLK